MKQNIKHIVDHALCTACGACAALCPTHAIGMAQNAAGYLCAVIDDHQCQNCGICDHVCPSNGREKLPMVKGSDIFHGKCLEGYMGYAADENIRKESQSGGVVTALLCYLLEKNIIGGAVVNQFDGETRRPKAVFATSGEEIITGCGSYYAQSPVIETALRHAQQKDTAAVVLGCQAESILKIRENYPRVKLPLYTIGLVCAGQNSGYMIDDLIEQSKCGKGESVTRFRFRDKSLGKWPGNVGVYTDRRIYKLNKQRRLDLKSIYESYRCILCYDQMNICSDLVVGDPWGITGDDIRRGYSVVITRTEKGEQLIRDASRDGAIEIERLPVKKIIEGQTVDGRHKTKFYTAKDFCLGNKWMWPYDERNFNNHDYRRPDPKTRNNIETRMEKARSFYLEEDRHKLAAMINDQKRKMKLAHMVIRPLRFLKRGISFVARKIGGANTT